MANTLFSTINWARAFVQYVQLTAGTGHEPSISIASMIRNKMTSAPLGWMWNRFEDSSVMTEQGVQDYTVNITNFGFLEKASLTDSEGKIWEIKDIYNTSALSKQTVPQSRPNAIAVISYIPETSIKIRFLAVPNAVYTVNLVYQAIATQFGPFVVNSAANTSSGNTAYNGIFTPAAFVVGQPAFIDDFSVNASNNGTFLVVNVTPTILTLANPNGIAEVAQATAVNSSWFPIPDSYSDIYNNLFLAEAFQAFGEDQEAARYRQIGVAGILARAEGLTETQRNAYIQQWMARGVENSAITLRVQQGSQARGI